MHIPLQAAKRSKKKRMREQQEEPDNSGGRNAALSFNQSSHVTVAPP